MCGNLFGSTPTPKVEKVAPPPTVQNSEAKAVNDTLKADNKRRRGATGADQMKSNVLQPETGSILGNVGKQKLGE